MSLMRIPGHSDLRDKILTFNVSYCLKMNINSIYLENRAKFLFILLEVNFNVQIVFQKILTIPSKVFVVMKATKGFDLL